MGCGLRSAMAAPSGRIKGSSNEAAIQSRHPWPTCQEELTLISPSAGRASSASRTVNRLTLNGVSAPPTDTSRTVWTAAAHRHHGLGYPPDARWRAAAILTYRPEYAASCRRPSCPHRSRTDRSESPLFRALHALAVDHAGGRAGLPPRCLPALHIQRVMNPFDRAVIIPSRQIVVHCALRRQVLGQIAPLAARAQHIHHAVHHLPHHHPASPPAMFGRWDQRFNQRPLLVGQVGRIAQLVAVVARAVLESSTSAPPAKRVPEHRITPVPSRSSPAP